MRIIDVTDDTVSVQKMLLDEIKSTQAVTKYSATGVLLGKPLPPLISIAMHRVGRKLLLRLLYPAVRHLEPDEEDLFGDSVTSKKSPQARRQENLAFLRTPLLAVCRQYAETLIRNINGCKVLEQVLATFFDSALLDAVTSVFAGMEVETIDMNPATSSDSDSESENESEDDEKKVGEDEAGEEEEQPLANDSDEESEEEDVKAAIPTEEVVLPIEEDKIAHTFLKRVVAYEIAVEGAKSASIGDDAIVPLDVDRSLWADAKPAVGLFAAALFQKLVDQERLPQWLKCNRACFALAFMLDVPSAAEAIKAVLCSGDSAKTIQHLSTTSAGAKALYTKLGLESMATTKGKKTAPSAATATSSTAKRSRK